MELTGLSGWYESYDVYVYLDDDRVADEAVLQQISDGTSTLYLTDPAGHTFEGVYVEAGSSDPAAAHPGNYVVFRGLSGDAATIRVGGVLPGERLARPVLAGLQVVGGPDKDAVFVGGDRDRDLLAGDEAWVTLFGGVVQELSAGAVGSGIPGLDRDVLTGGDDADFLLGGAGDDVLQGAGGSDVLLGDGGSLRRFEDRIVDFVADAGAGGADRLEGGGGDDWLYGQGGGDTYVFSGLDLGVDRLFESDGSRGVANDGNDRLDFQGFGASVDFDLGDKNVQKVGSSRREDLFVDLSSGHAFEGITGSRFSDRLDGNVRPNGLAGGAGDDRLDGRTGNDFLQGGEGRDELRGGSGDDVLVGGPDRDDLAGGRGADTLYPGGFDVAPALSLTGMRLDASLETLMGLTAPRARLWGELDSSHHDYVARILAMVDDDEPIYSLREIDLG